MSSDAPLEGLIVLEFAQFLAGPLCGLRLADLGARVIKIERAGSGDLSRQLYLSDTDTGGVNSLFQAINRNKESFSADLKSTVDQAMIRTLVASADVVIQNFRPGVFDRLGFSYEAVAAINPKIIYASVSGYGTHGPWVGLPGQDLLAQARSGLMWLNGHSGQPPQATGLAVGDMLAGHNLTQAVLASLVRRGISGQGAKVDTSLLEGLIDFQFEVLTTYLNDGGRKPERSNKFGAHAYLAAPYGVYPTLDGHLAMAMTPLQPLMQLMGVHEKDQLDAEQRSFTSRDEINTLLARYFSDKTTQQWLDIFQPNDIWCADVLSWDELLESDGFDALQMIQTLKLPDGQSVYTTRAPFSFNGATPTSDRCAPMIGEHTAAITTEFGLSTTNKH